MLTFQTLLREEGINPKQVRLLRHTPKSGVRGMSPFAAWHQRRELFEEYQSTQLSKDRKFFSVDFWASFVSTPARETLFVGLYEIGRAHGPVAPFTCPLTHIEHDGSSVDRFETALAEPLQAYAGCLLVDWGAGTRSWGQHADRNLKPVLELRRQGSEPAYPGHSAFMRQLNEVEALPPSWRAILMNAKGVYLITCPVTREQYVGSAYGDGGFIARWEQHARQEGDAAAFRVREPSAYRVSILEVAGSLANDRDILAMEDRWKQKLQSREMGLNRN